MRRWFFVFILLSLVSCFSVASQLLPLSEFLSLISGAPSLSFAQNISTDTVDLSLTGSASNEVVISHETRIVGGQTVTDPSKYPWMAALVYSNEDDLSFGQFCGGVLIEPFWVLTAAHCVCEDYSTLPLQAQSIDVVLGMLNLNASPDTYERIEVSKIIVHPDYDDILTDNDFALIQLKTPSTKQPIDFLATPENDFSILKISLASKKNIMATAMGWGSTEPKNRSYPDQLQEVKIPLVSNDDCAVFFGEGEITENMLCAGFVEGGKDACLGDSGGPLVTLHPDGGYILTGIVSWGNGCAQPESYGVYSRVSKGRDWIFQQTGYPVILTDSTPTKIYSGGETTVYGGNWINNLTVQSGAHAKLVNFPGINIISFQESSSLFRVSRSGATVTFEDEINKTKLVISASNAIQLIGFEDLTAILQVQSGKVILGDQTVTQIEAVVNP
ncbi:MAG: serine protease [Desulfamplus sp.]|nr:serine protease [Desulfamplus sp.]MBF0257609.1 serine protease [Desulfamplus sp.]